MSTTSKKTKAGQAVRNARLYPDTTEAKSTRLYKALIEVIRPEDHEELARMLQLAMKSEGWRGDYGNLNLSMRWAKTPQGQSYWIELAIQLGTAGCGRLGWGY